MGFCYLSAKSQEGKIETFKDFIQILEQKDKDNSIKISDSIYLKFLNDCPVENDEVEKSIRILLKRDGFVGLLHASILEMGRSEESKLITYNWEGKIITEFEYSSGKYGDYFSESNTCELKPNDNLICTHKVNEGGLEEVTDDKGNFIGTNYIIVTDETNYEYYKIFPDGNIELAFTLDDD
jgi:hypothetical protein